MPYSSTAEIYFISAMFLLIFVICGTACYFFFKTYRREKAAKEEALRQKITRQQNAETKAAEISTGK